VADHRFGTGVPYSLRVVEELLLVDGRDLSPVRDGSEALAGLRPPLGALRPDVLNARLETAAPAGMSVADTVDVLALLRAELQEAGVHALGVGVHPAARLEGVRALDGARPGVLRRAPCCGMRVHVAMPDADTAIRACNGMRRWVPLLHALGANSPFGRGVDSGFASLRGALLHPALPDRFRDYAHYRRCAATGDAEDAWPALRPRPDLGTLEIGAPDVQSCPHEAEALIALIGCLVVHEAGSDGDDVPQVALESASELALRDGIRATLPFEGDRLPVAQLAALAVRRVTGIARRRGCADALGGIAVMLREGNGAERRRAAHRRGGLRAVLEQLHAETLAGSYRRFDAAA
jgi:carboxylate-amine ligase